MNFAWCAATSRPRRPYFSLARTTIERPSGVSSARLDSCAASASSPSVTPVAVTNSTAWRLPSVIVPVLSSSSVLTSPAASTALPLIASTLCCITRSMPAMPMAESRPPIVVGIRQTSSATYTAIVGAVPAPADVDAVDGVGHQRRDGEQEDDRQAGDHDVQGDLVRRLLPLGALDERNHAIEERLARVRRDLDLDPVRQHARAAGDRAAVAARFADDRRAFAGDDRLVDRGDALDDLAVAGDALAGRADDDVAGPQLGGRHLLDLPVRQQPVRDGVRLGLAQRFGLRLAARFGHRFGERREEHGEPEPEVDLHARSRCRLCPVTMSRIRNSSTSTAPTSTTKMTGFFISVTGFSFSTDSLAAFRRISGSNSGRARTSFFGISERLVDRRRRRRRDGRQCRGCSHA